MLFRVLCIIRMAELMLRESSSNALVASLLSLALADDLDDSNSAVLADSIATCLETVYFPHCVHIIYAVSSKS